VPWPRAPRRLRPLPQPCQVGVAADARKRLRELQVGSPVELKLTLTQPYADRRDADAVAEELHRCFAGGEQARLLALLAPTTPTGCRSSRSLPLDIATKVLPARRRSRHYPPLGSPPGRQAHPVETRTAASSHSHCSCRSAELSHFGGKATAHARQRPTERMLRIAAIYPAAPTWVRRCPPSTR
jgi:hypothetical protein